MGSSYRNSGTSSRSRRSLSLVRSNTNNSFSSIDSADSYLHHANNQEIFSGAASEIIPSSITSLHYPHELHRVRDRRNTGSNRETHLLLEGYSDEMSINSSVSAASSDTQRGFKFFSPEVIEGAPGGSTIENPDDPVDYNTNWEYSIGKFADEEFDMSQKTSGDYDLASNAIDLISVEESIKSFGIQPGNRRESGSEGSFSNNRFDTTSFESDHREFEEKYSSTSFYQRYYLAEEDLVIGIAGYKDSLPKRLLYSIICIFTLGLGYLILRWFPKYRVNLQGYKCPLGKADWCVVENEFGELTIVNVKKSYFNERLSNFLTVNEIVGAPGGQEYEDDSDLKNYSNPIVPYVHSFRYRYINFFYNPVEDIFKTNSNWYDIHWNDIKSLKEGNSQLSQQTKEAIFDKNNIELDEKPIGKLLVEEILHPFYIFQIFSIVLWLEDNYYYYAFCIFLISFVTIINTLIETKSTMKRLQQMSKFSCEVRVWRNGFWKQIDSNELLPGDVFEVDSSLSLIPCDAILINGECMVNESMLTGESVPVTKIAATFDTVRYLKEDFTSPVLAKSYLYNGTRLLKSRVTNEEPVTATCVKTGFNTVKGSLVRSMLFPKPSGFKFYEDSFKYIGFMTLIAAIGFCYSTYNFIQLGSPTRLMIVRALDIITIVVPPALPATLTIGTTFSLSRLKKQNIYCISPMRVNVGGKIDVVCFDKTGTLTEEGLDVMGLLLANNAQGRKEIVFSEMIDSISSLEASIRNDQSTHDTNNARFLLGAMTSCHSLRIIDEEILGDELDLKMFKFTNFNLSDATGFATAESGSGNICYSTWKEYEFKSELRRMSVIAQDGERVLCYTKGAPEMLNEICIPESIPHNYEEVLSLYTHRGYRVIATACKVMDVNSQVKNIAREEAESNLIFTGFIVFENRLKPSSKPTLRELSDAKIRTVMCTGDNVLTAISVAKDCNLVSQDVDEIYLSSIEKTEDGILKVRWHEVNDPSKRLESDTLEPLLPDYCDMSEDKFTENYRLAITGDIFRHILTDLTDTTLKRKILMKCDIFARMSPDEKNELVEQLQKLDYTVCFCGDGANDCGALKAADVGISLSEAEASVAAPFTSRKFEISCVINVIKEGRSSLVTSFACFKYMSLYSAIQFITITILYKRGTNLGDFQFLYIDLLLILPLAILMSWSKPYKRLVVKRPSANLVSPKILIPICCHILSIMIAQILLWIAVQKEPWYIRPVLGNDDEVKSSDNTVLFLFSNFQYIFMAAILNTGAPYREPIKSNTSFMVNLITSIIISTMLFFVDPDSRWGEIMQLTKLSTSFYLLILVFACLNFLFMFYGERVWFPMIAALYKRIRNRGPNKKSKKLFKNLRMDLEASSSV